MNLTEQQIKSMPTETSLDWKFGVITRNVYRISENNFELNETCGTWVTASVNLDTMVKLVKGEISVTELEWK